MNSLKHYSFNQQVFAVVASCFIVSFGQPSWLAGLGLIASVVGYALLWRVTAFLPSKKRFLVASAWYTVVQGIQLSWFLSHPYAYIYFVHAALSIALGITFGLFSLLIDSKRIQSVCNLMGIASLWALLEWTRILPLSGLSFNPAGLALTGNLYPLQMATLFGVFGLTFWVIMTNLLLLRNWILGFTVIRSTALAAFILLPYLFGIGHVYFRDKEPQATSKFSALVVNLTFPPEEILGLKDLQGYISTAQDEWRRVLVALNNEDTHLVDMVIFPEGFVPFGGQYCFYDSEEVKKIFVDVFGEDSIASLPPLKEPWAHEIILRHESRWLVSNTYFVMALMRRWGTDILIGLEDVAEIGGKKEAFNAALFYRPATWNKWERYAKRVLVPMAEYIPFSWCKSFASKYGICDSFCHGEGPRVFKTSKGTPFGVTICYEETFGAMMKENRAAGAELLVNLTSDVWYPNSRLAWQHYDLARLRTVEMGIPLVRSCNYGVSGALDSLSRPIALCGGERQLQEGVADVLRVDIPLKTYKTLYAWWGDIFILAACFTFGTVAIIKSCFWK